MTKTQRISGKIIKLEPEFGNGGVGFIIDPKGTTYFFHCRDVLGKKFHALALNNIVEFTPIAARSAMRAGAQAKNIKVLAPPSEQAHLKMAVLQN